MPSSFCVLMLSLNIYPSLYSFISSALLLLLTISMYFSLSFCQRYSFTFTVPFTELSVFVVVCHLHFSRPLYFFKLPYQSLDFRHDGFLFSIFFPLGASCIKLICCLSLPLFLATVLFFQRSVSVAICSLYFHYFKRNILPFLL